MRKIFFGKLCTYVESENFKLDEFLLYLNKYLGQSPDNFTHLKSLLPSVFKTGNLQLAEMLLSSADCNLNSESDWGGMTTFLYAARDCKFLEILKLLVKYGADVKATSKYGTTALQFASMNNPNPKIIDYLVTKGLNTKIKDRGKTLLMLAAHQNPNPQVLEALIQHGNNLYEYYRDWGCLVYAVRGGQKFEIIEFILNKAYKRRWFHRALDINKPDYRNRTALMYALQSCKDKEIIYLLLERGANPCIIDIHGWSSLRFAIYYWDVEIVRHLLLHYSFENNIDKLFRLPIFEFACIRGGEAKMLPLLIHYGFGPVNLEICYQLAHDTHQQSQEKIEFLNSL